MADDYIRRNPNGDRAPRSGAARSSRPSCYASSSDGIRRSSSASRPSGSRPSAARPSGARPSSARSGAARPSGARPSGARPAGSRPSGYASGRAPQRRPASRRRRRSPQPRFFIIIAVAVIILLALIFFLFGGKKQPATPAAPMATPTAAPMSAAPGVEVYTNNSDTDIDPTSEQPSAPAAAANNAADLEAQLSDSDTEVAALSDADRVHVSDADLSINPNLPSEWINIAFLGTDERKPGDDARTDAIIICSINQNNGRVKLTSIARDTAVDIKGTGKYDGTYRINAINFFGGPNYVMKFLNEKLNLNIQYYVTVNFFGFQKIAEMLGGIDVNITEGEMNEINNKQKRQAANGYYAGIDESDLENVLLETYGENTHLNGRQTLAYARVRYVDNDMSRMERQRTVLVKLMEKLRGKSTTELLAIASTMINHVKTNMDFNFMVDIAMKVLSGDMTKVDSLRLPINGSFKQERRGDKDMLWDTDWSVNANELYNFIYVT